VLGDKYESHGPDGSSWADEPVYDVGMSRRESNHFVYRLIPPRPTFHLDMNDEERAVMDRHVQYWEAQTAAGKVVVYGPVVEPNGSWGLGVLTADDESEAQAMLDGDPAISSGMATFELGRMPVAVLPD
jgi:uncharacterized protein YciI